LKNGRSEWFAFAIEVMELLGLGGNAAIAGLGNGSFGDTVL